MDRIVLTIGEQSHEVGIVGGDPDSADYREIVRQMVEGFIEAWADPYIDEDEGDDLP